MICEYGEEDEKSHNILCVAQMLCLEQVVPHIIGDRILQRVHFPTAAALAQFGSLDAGVALVARPYIL